MQISPLGGLKRPKLLFTYLKPLEVHFYEFLKGLYKKKEEKNRQNESTAF